jgi:hypothetical protein
LYDFTKYFKDSINGCSKNAHGLVVEAGQDVGDEQAPPHVQIVALVGAHVARHRLRVQVVAVVPGLLRADEVNDAHAVSEPENKIFFYKSLKKN